MCMVNNSEYKIVYSGRSLSPSPELWSSSPEATTVTGSFVFFQLSFRMASAETSMRCCLLLHIGRVMELLCAVFTPVPRGASQGEICSRVEGRRKNRSERECRHRSWGLCLLLSPILLLQGRSTVSLARALWNNLFMCVSIFLSPFLFVPSLSLSLSLVSPPLSSMNFSVFLCWSFSHKLYALSLLLLFIVLLPSSVFLWFLFLYYKGLNVTLTCCISQLCYCLRDSVSWYPSLCSWERQLNGLSLGDQPWQVSRSRGLEVTSEYAYCIAQESVDYCGC